MRRVILAAAAAATLSTPALARDGQPYIGIEGGAVFGQKTNFDIDLLDDGEVYDSYNNGVTDKVELMQRAENAIKRVAI